MSHPATSRFPPREGPQRRRYFERGAGDRDGHPEYKERLSGIGMEPLRMTPEQAAAYTKREIEKWSKVAKAANVRLD